VVGAVVPIGRIRAILPIGRIRAILPIGRIRAILPIGRIRAILPTVRIRAIALLWIWQGVLALVAGWPGAAMVRAAFAGDPDGEGVFLRPGGHALLSFLARNADGVQGALGGGLVVLVVGAAASLLPTAMLFFAIEGDLRGRAPFSLKSTVVSAVRSFPAFAVLFVGFGLVQALLLGAGAFLAPLVANLSEAWAGEARSQVFAAIAVLVLALGAAYLALLQDVARAALVRRKQSALGGLGAGLTTLQAHPWPLMWAWAWRGALSWAPLAAIASAPGIAPTRGAPLFVAVALLHQGAVLWRIALRASWVAVAVRYAGLEVRSDR